MKALVYTGAETLDFRDAPEPIPAEGEKLVRIESVGICGSDMHAFLGHDERRPAPLILGHEACGVLEDGKRVTINPLVACGKCDGCASGRENLCRNRQIISMPPREGAFAEQVAMPSSNLVVVPDGVSPDKAALAEPIACGWHTARLGKAMLDRPIDEARCVVYGGGAIGLGAALSLVAMGAREIWVAEPHTERRAIVERAGDFRGFDPSDNAPEDVDFAIDGVGIEATRAAATAKARPGGTIAHIGLGSGEGGLDIRRMTLQEITFFGTYTYTAQDFRDTAAAIFDGRLGTLDWMEMRPLSEGAAAFAALRAGSVAAPKIVLKP